jgi:hypothetical protein
MDRLDKANGQSEYGYWQEDRSSIVIYPIHSHASFPKYPDLHHKLRVASFLELLVQLVYCHELAQ